MNACTRGFALDCGLYFTFENVTHLPDDFRHIQRLLHSQFIDGTSSL
jgi:hypothetical protein